MSTDPLVRELWRQIVWPEGKGLCVTDKNPVICHGTGKKLSVVVRLLSHKRLGCCEMFFEHRLLSESGMSLIPPFPFSVLQVGSC